MQYCYLLISLYYVTKLTTYFYTSHTFTYPLFSKIIYCAMTHSKRNNYNFQICTGKYIYSVLPKDKTAWSRLITPVRVHYLWLGEEIWPKVSLFDELQITQLPWKKMKTITHISICDLLIINDTDSTIKNKGRTLDKEILKLCS